MNDIERKSIELAAQSDEKYPVDFDSAWQWIGYTRKDNALAALKRSFFKDLDFSCAFRKSTGGRPSEEIRLTKDCFKQFCMLAETLKGREVREYFVRCEEKLQQIEHIVSQPGMSLEEMTLVVISGMQAKIAVQAAIIEAQKPAVEYVDSYVDAKGSLSFRRAANVFKIPQSEFIDYLLKNKLVYRDQSEKLCAYSAHIQAGIFVELTGKAQNEHVYTQTRITPYGMTYIARLTEGA